VIVVGVYELRSAPLSRRIVNSIEMCVDRRGMIVIRSRLLSRMDVLERREKESHQQSKTCLERGDTTHSYVSVHFRDCGATPGSV